MSSGLLGQQSRYLERLIIDGDLSPAEVDGLRRLSPFRRDAFDDLLHTSLRVALMEGSWDNVDYAFRHYLSTVRGDSRPPELIPPAIAGIVADTIAEFRLTREPDEHMYGDSFRLSAFNQGVAEQMMFALGGDLGDGVLAAGARTYSRMISARISDGFLHPALGARLWAEYPRGRTGPMTGGRHIAVTRTIAALSDAWVATPTQRPQFDRMILDRAHAHGWAEAPPVADDYDAAPEGSGWYTTPPDND